VYTAVGEELRTARVIRWKTQDDVAEALGISRTTVTNLEASRHRLRMDRFLDWCDYLNVDPADIITRIAEQTRPALVTEGNNMDKQPTAVDVLAAKVNLDPDALAVMRNCQDRLTALVGDLDRAMADQQGYPDETGQRIVRALLLRGTLENLVHNAILAQSQKEKETQE
jgi:transcriptional regulator with XRE-family HTH domain